MLLFCGTIVALMALFSSGESFLVLLFLLLVVVAADVVSILQYFLFMTAKVSIKIVITKRKTIIFFAVTKKKHIFANHT